MREKWYLANPAEIGESDKVWVLHGAGLWALRCHKQEGIVQLSNQLGFHLRMLRYEVPAQPSPSERSILLSCPRVMAM